MNKQYKILSASSLRFVLLAPLLMLISVAELHARSASVDYINPFIGMGCVDLGSVLMVPPTGAIQTDRTQFLANYSGILDFTMRYKPDKNR